MRTDTDFAEDVIRRALQRGVDQAEIFIRSSKNLSVEIKEQAVDSLTSSRSFGYSLRVIKDGRLGFSYSTEKKDSDAVITAAAEAARYADADRFLDLPGAAGSSEVEVFDPVLSEVSEEDVIRKVRLLEKTVFEEDRRIARVRKASGSFSVSETAIVNSKDVNERYASTSCSAQIMAVAEESGESQIGWDYEGSRFLRDISFEEIGKNAARRAVRLLGSRKMEGRKTNVLLENPVTVDFLGIFASSLSAESVQKGKSLLAGKKGSRVISPRVNMIDSGLLPGKLGSSPVDAEGVPAREKTVIQEGILRTYLYNTYTAKKEGIVSSGNAVRGGFSSLPSVGVTNLFLEAVSKDDVVPVERIFQAFDRGLYIVDAMGVHTANPVSGEFSIGVTGLWIENGEVQYPVKEAVISGNILDFFNRIEAVGDDLRFYGNVGAPSLIIADVDISG